MQPGYGGDYYPDGGNGYGAGAGGFDMGGPPMNDGPGIGGPPIADKKKFIQQKQEEADDWGDDEELDNMLPS